MAIWCRSSFVFGDSLTLNALFTWHVFSMLTFCRYSMNTFVYECFLILIKAIMRNLVRRYVTQEQRKAENEGVTEDDVNEIKNDISAFRFELIEILRQSGMNVTSATGQLGQFSVQ